MVRRGEGREGRPRCGPTSPLTASSASSRTTQTSINWAADSPEGNQPLDQSSAPEGARGAGAVRGRVARGAAAPQRAGEDQPPVRGVQGRGHARAHRPRAGRAARRVRPARPEEEGGAGARRVRPAAAAAADAVLVAPLPSAARGPDVLPPRLAGHRPRRSSRGCSTARRARRLKGRSRSRVRGRLPEDGPRAGFAGECD